MQAAKGTLAAEVARLKVQRDLARVQRNEYQQKLIYVARRLKAIARQLNLIIKLSKRRQP